jgi:hypothetical protein
MGRLTRHIRQKFAESDLILFLDNQSLDGTYINDVYEDLSKDRKIALVEHAFQNIETLKELLFKTKLIVAETSFMYGEQIYPLVQLLAEYQPMTIVIINRMGSITSFFKEWVPLDVVEKMSKHTLFVVDSSDDRLEEEYDFDHYIKANTPKKADLKGLTVTGRKILIKRITGSGSEFDYLEQFVGQEVDELNYWKPNQFFGPWVAGKTEPVKLINFDNRHEFEYVYDNQAQTVADYFFSLTPQKVSIATLEYKASIALWLGRWSGKLSVEDGIEEFLEIRKVERRGNRDKLRKLCKKYLDNHSIFLEYSHTKVSRLVEKDYYFNEKLV